MFYLVSIHQLVSVFLATFINVGAETLVFGFILQTCTQLEIFGIRLHKNVANGTKRSENPSSVSSSKEDESFADCIRHHLSIYRLIISHIYIDNFIYRERTCVYKKYK